MKYIVGALQNPCFPFTNIASINVNCQCLWFIYYLNIWSLRPIMALVYWPWKTTFQKQELHQGWLTFFMTLSIALGTSSAAFSLLLREMFASLKYKFDQLSFSQTSLLNHIVVSISTIRHLSLSTATVKALLRQKIW